MIAIFGIVGSICNIIIFTHLKNFRNHPGTFYIIAESVVDLTILLFGAVLRVIDEFSPFSSTAMIFFWCHFRQLLIQWGTMMFLYFVIFAVIDQFLSTNHRPRLRLLSTVKLAKYLITIGACFWLIYSIPFATCFGTKVAYGCTGTNAKLILYYSYFHLFVLNGVLPMFIACAFSISAYRNVRRIYRQQMSHTRRRIDQQMTAMILARSVFYTILLVPYNVQTFYNVNNLNRTVDQLQTAIMLLIGAINISLSYLNTAVCELLFLFLSH